MFCISVIVEKVCQSDSDCPSQTGCINKLCVSPCDASMPCGVNSKCKVLDTFPVRTMTCECLPGTQGNAAIQCDEGKYFQKRLILTIIFFDPEIKFKLEMISNYKLKFYSTVLYKNILIYCIMFSVQMSDRQGIH